MTATSTDALRGVYTVILVRNLFSSEGEGFRANESRMLGSPSRLK